MHFSDTVIAYRNPEEMYGRSKTKAINPAKSEQRWSLLLQGVGLDFWERISYPPQMPLSRKNSSCLYWMKLISKARIVDDATHAVPPPASLGEISEQSENILRYDLFLLVSS